MANYKNKTGRGEVNFKSPAQTFNGKEIFLADDRHSNASAGGGPADLSRPFVARDPNGSPNSHSLKGHLVFQLRAEPFGVSDVSGNKFPAIEYSGSLEKRLEKVTHHHTLKTLEFKDNRILTLTASTDNVPIGNGPDGMIYRTAYDEGDIANETILPYSDGGTNGAEICVLAGWIYAEDDPASRVNGSCIMEMVQESTEKRTFGLILTQQGELTWRFYNPTQAFVNNFGNQFQQITTIKKLQAKTWYHFCIIMRGNGPQGSTHQFNSSGLDNRHQSHGAEHTGPQVAIYINGHREEVSQANASSMSNYTFSSSGINFPIVFGRGLGDYDSGSGGSLAKDTVFRGRLSEVSWFYLAGGSDGAESIGRNRVKPPILDWRGRIAQSLMNATHNASSGYANVSERLLLKDSDSNRTYHPTVKRSGDPRRLGNNKIFFDDGKAQTLSGSVVHYPTKLVKNDPLRHSIYKGYIDGDLHIDGAIPSTDSYDTHYVRESVARFDPFEESRLHITDADFFQTGTLDSVIPGFDTPLKNKDVIEFSLGTAKLGIQDFNGLPPSTGSASGILEKLNGLDFTFHLPSMFYFNNSTKGFEPLSNNDGNFGGIKNASSEAGLVSISGSVQSQQEKIAKELRLGFAPFEGQPLTVSEQFINPHPYNAEDLGYGQGSALNNLKGGIIAQYTASLSAPSDGDQIRLFFQRKDSTGDFNNNLDGNTQEEYYLANHVEFFPNSGYYPAGPDATEENSDAYPRTGVDMNDTSKVVMTVEPIPHYRIVFNASSTATPTNFNNSFSTNNGEPFPSGVNLITLGTQGKSLATIVSQVSTIIGNLSSYNVSSTTGTEIRFHRAYASDRNLHKRNNGTYAGFSLTEIEGAQEDSALKLVGDGALTNIAGPTSTFGFPWSHKYHHDPSNTVKMSDYITEPFLAEKIEVSFTAKASSGYATESVYYVFSNEAPNKYVPRFVTPVGGSSTFFTTLAAAGYPPAAAESSYVADEQLGGLVPAISNIQYAHTNGSGFYFIETSTNGNGGLDAKTKFDDYHFFILKQDRKNISQMDEKKSAGALISGTGVSDEAIDVTAGTIVSSEKDFSQTNRELLHHSKILVHTTGQAGEQSLQRGMTQRQTMVLDAVTGSFDLLLSTKGNLAAGNASSGQIHRHQPSNNFVPLFDLPYTGSNIGRFVGNTHTDTAYEQHLQFQKDSSVTGSYVIRKSLQTQLKYKENYSIFFNHHPRITLGSFHNHSPNSMLRLSNALGGYQQTEAFGTRAFGPGNISASDGTSKSYSTSNAFDSTTTSQTTGSINVKQPVDFGSTPTILLPEDDLIFGFQNAINALQAMAPYDIRKGKTISDLGHLHAGFQQHIDYQVFVYPHLHIENLKVKIFGSYLRNSQPKNFQLNQMLGSDVIHESIGAESIHDQFDIAPRGVFSGSYVDEIMSGSTVSPYSGFNSLIHAHAAGSPPATDFTNLARRVNSRSSEGTHGVTGSLRRNVSFASADKTEYDSFLFDLGGMFNVDERSQNVPDNGKFGFPGNYIDDFETGSNKVDTLLLGSDPSLIGNVANFNTNVTPNVDLGASFLNARYSSVTKVRQPQIGAGANLFNIAATGSYNVPGLIERIEGNASFIGARYITGDDGLSNLPSLRTSKIIFGIGNGVQNAHRLSAPSSIMFKDVIRGFRYGLSNITDKKPRNVFRRDRYGQLRDMLEMAPNTAYIDDVSNTISYPIEARFFSDDGSIAAPDQTSASNLSTNCTSSAPYFDRDVEIFDDPAVIRNRGPLNNQIADITIEI